MAESGFNIHRTTAIYLNYVFVETVMMTNLKSSHRTEAKFAYSMNFRSMMYIGLLSSLLLSSSNARHTGNLCRFSLILLPLRFAQLNIPPFYHFDPSKY